MDWWAITMVGVGLLILGAIKKMDSLVTLHVEWGLVRLEFLPPPRKKVKKPIAPRAPRQLKQVKRISR